MGKKNKKTQTNLKQNTGINVGEKICLERRQGMLFLFIYFFLPSGNSYSRPIVEEILFAFLRRHLTAETGITVI